MEHETILILFRGSERILISILGGVSLVLGWKLFSQGIYTAQKGTIEIGSWKLHSKGFGPGIFFALFGAYILVFSLNSKLELPGVGKGANVKDGLSYRNSLENNDLDLKFSKGVSSIQLAKGALINDPNISSEARTDLVYAFKAIENFREHIVSSAVGREKFSIYKRYILDPNFESTASNDEKESLLEVTEWY